MVHLNRTTVLLHQTNMMAARLAWLAYANGMSDGFHFLDDAHAFGIPHPVFRSADLKDNVATPLQVIVRQGTETHT